MDRTCQRWVQGARCGKPAVATVVPDPETYQWRACAEHAEGIEMVVFLSSVRGRADATRVAWDAHVEAA